MTVPCPLCDGEMVGVPRLPSEGGSGWTMLECRHCGAMGTSNLVIMHLKVIAELRELKKQFVP